MSNELPDWYDAEAESTTTNPRSSTFNQVDYMDGAYDAVSDDLAEAVDRFKDRHSDALRRFMDRRDAVAGTGRNVRLTAGFTVMSVDTATVQAERMADRFMTGDFGADRDAVMSTTDGAVKWDHVHDWFGDEMPDTVAGHFGAGDWEDGMVELSGFTPDGDAGTTYFRPVKASLVAYLMGDDWALCWDRRVHRVLRETGTLASWVRTRHVAYPATRDDRFRSDATRRMDRKSRDLMQHKTADGLSRDFWCDGLARNLAEYRAITGNLIEAVARRTDAEPGEVPIILFNLGRPDDALVTFHQSLMSRLTDE